MYSYEFRVYDGKKRGQRAKEVSHPCSMRSHVLISGDEVAKMIVDKAKQLNVPAEHVCMFCHQTNDYVLAHSAT